MDQETRPCFRRCFVSGTTRKHANEAATALQRPRSAPADFYLQATPRLGFSNTRETCSLAPEEPLPAATVLPSLAGDLHPADHVPRGRYPSGLPPYVPGSRLGIVSTEMTSVISLDRTQKHRVTLR